MTIQNIPRISFHLSKAARGRPEGPTDRSVFNFFFRAFQGWLSLSEAGPGDGTLKVLPLLKEALAHALIRPLLKDIPEDELPNYYPHKILYLDQQLHARLINAIKI